MKDLKEKIIEMMPPFGMTKTQIYEQEQLRDFIKLQFEPKSFWKKFFCNHYWVEVDRRFHGLTEGTIVIWGCGKFGKKIERNLLDLPFNPLIED